MAITELPDKLKQQGFSTDIGGSEATWRLYRNGVYLTYSPIHLNGLQMLERVAERILEAEKKEVKA